MKTFTSDIVRHVFPGMRFNVEGKIELEQNFRINCINAFGDNINNKKDFDILLSKKIGHPVCAPIYIENIKKNDSIEIYIKDISINHVMQSISKSTGFLDSSNMDRNFKLISNKNDLLQFNNISLLAKPTVGFLSVIPDKKFSCGRASKYGGNLDINFLRKASKIRLPIFVDGAGLMVGDLHALQGNGEGCGIAMEASGKIELEIRKSKKTSFPIIETDDKIVIVGTGDTLEELFKDATRNALKFVTYSFGFSILEDSYMFVSAVGNYGLGNATGNVKTGYISFSKCILLSLKSNYRIYDENNLNENEIELFNMIKDI